MPDMRPKTVTEAELVTVLLPYIQGFPWALDTIGDLWRMGSPAPMPGPNGELMRIILPGQFQKWWGDVCERMGYDRRMESVLSGLPQR